MTYSKQYLRFRVGSQWYGLPIEDVVEVSYFMLLNELPGTTPDVLGLMTIHDEVIPVVDLRIRFGAKQSEYKLDTPIIATRTTQGTVGLVVDNAEALEPVQESETVHYAGSDLPFLSGAVKGSHGLLLLVDPEKLAIKPESVL